MRSCELLNLDRSPSSPGHRMEMEFRSSSHRSIMRSYAATSACESASMMIFRYFPSALGFSSQIRSAAAPTRTREGGLSSFLVSLPSHHLVDKLVNGTYSS